MTHRPTFAQTQRLIYIDAALQTGASIKPKHIAADFYVSVSKAKQDLALFAELFPNRIVFMHSSKTYQRVDSSAPVFSNRARFTIREARAETMGALNDLKWVANASL
jgi:hypothetical protein